MSVPEVKTEISTEEALAALQELGRQTDIKRRKAGLPPIDGVELQRKYKDLPVSKEISDFVDEFVDSLPSSHR